MVALLLCGCAFSQSDPGTYDEATRLYRNRTYAFTCKVPAGWVLRTEQLKPDGAADNQVLLAAFEHPPEATGPAPASTILIASESQSAYPGLKTAEDYFGPLTEVVTAKGFQAVNDPYSFPVDAVQVMREDFPTSKKIVHPGIILRKIVLRRMVLRKIVPRCISPPSYSSPTAPFSPLRSSPPAKTMSTASSKICL